MTEQNYNFKNLSDSGSSAEEFFKSMNNSGAVTIQEEEEEKEVISIQSDSDTNSLLQEKLIDSPTQQKRKRTRSRKRRGRRRGGKKRNNCSTSSSNHHHTGAQLFNTVGNNVNLSISEGVNNFTFNAEARKPDPPPATAASKPNPSHTQHSTTHPPSLPILRHPQVASTKHFGNVAQVSQQKIMNTIKPTYLTRDKILISNSRGKGYLSKIENWKLVKEHFQNDLSNIVKRQVKVYRIDIADLGPSNEIKVDEYLRTQDAIFIHNNYIVVAATFTKELSNEIIAEANFNLNLNTQLNEKIIQGLRIVSKYSSNNRITNTYTADFGMGTLEQSSGGSLKQGSESSSIFKTTQTMRGVSIDNTYRRKSFRNAVTNMYTKICLPHFSSLNPPHFYEDPSLNKQRSPRFGLGSIRANYESLHSFRLPYLLKSSIVDETTKRDEELAAQYECNIRAVSEWVLGKCFGSLPYGAAAFINSMNIERACQQSNSSPNIVNQLSISQCSRPLPKGSIGLFKTKNLHDDSNACVIPGIWRSITDNPTTYLRIVTTKFDLQMKCLKNRLVFFYGWMPHQTFEEGKMDVESAEEGRIHHSAYSRPEIEHMGLNMFRNEYEIKQSLETVEERLAKGTK